MQTVLVTGASSGLGLALARLLVQHPYHLVLTARRSSLWRFTAEGFEESEHLWLRELDVTSAEQRERLIQEADERLDGIDILINNAGVAYRSVVEHVLDEDQSAQIDINFQSPMELIRLCLPSMRRKRAGRIINVSSVGGMMAMPTMAIYSASKWALEGATEALYYEARPWNIKVSLVQPGFIRSSSFRRVRYTQMSNASKANEMDPYFMHYQTMTPFIERLMRSSWATPEKVARTILKTMQRKNPALRIPATPDAVAFYMLRRLLPRRLYHWVLFRNLPQVQTWGC